MVKRKPVARTSNLWRVAGALICVLGLFAGIACGVWVYSLGMPDFLGQPAAGWVMLATWAVFGLMGLPLMLLPTLLEFRREGLLPSFAEVVRALSPFHRSAPAQYGGPDPSRPYDPPDQPL